jgi:hypothetical protein
MKINLKLIALLILSLISTYVLSCEFSTDCEIGSKCIKPRGSIYGYCMGGSNPGNQNDRKPSTNPYDMTGAEGNTCTFDLDCGIGGQCVKGNGIEGICL